MKKFLLICFLLSNLLFANDKCTLNDDILLTILMTERSLEKGIVGYEYIVSLNNKKDQITVRKDNYFNLMMINNRTIDCKDTKTCVEVLNKLLDKNIRNLDIGPFQINSIFHLEAFDSYHSLFDIEDSLKFACNYVMSKIDRLGYSWESIAAYHSETPELNERYKKDLIKNYNLLTSVTK